MKIRIIMVGKTKQSWVIPSVEEYRKRCKRYLKLEELVLAEGKGTPDQVRESEGKAILKACEGAGHVIVLDERGKGLRSPEFAQRLGQLRDQGNTTIALVIGGAFGVSQAIRDRSGTLLALSKMTFPHQFVRAILYEQLYRAFTILRGEPYHH